MSHWKFNFIYEMSPIDIWEGALIPSPEESERVLDQMPEGSRDGSVYKVMMFYNGMNDLFPVYLCKADNNGTVYVFSDINLKDALLNIRRTNK